MEESGIERHFEEVEFAELMKRKKAFPGKMESVALRFRSCDRGK